MSVQASQQLRLQPEGVAFVITAGQARSNDDSPPINTRVSHILRHDKRLAVLVLEHVVGRIVIDEALGFAVHLED